LNYASQSTGHNYFTHFQKKLGAIDSNTKLILDEIQKHFEDHDVTWERKIELAIRAAHHGMARPD
jgi:hypothetical protein